ncbi:NUDIX hydrolase [Acrocarpospora phusangensis]|uniref:NUDIX hydrolase n=1 Tax=Acrocarpospora phusangensis TaxID=1070424 RepID=A0A919QHP4_9ACTN|nr:NUDIX domain-containing protein [Acrocarpospora phusangensis]GIH26412.1 NUDIX hydrolase [Acrocarpospora phusangensis]
MIGTTGRDPEALAVSVDLVIFTVRGDELNALLVERGNEPYRGACALPGGYVRAGETLDQAALRELREETSLDGGRVHLEQLRAYSEPDRDPRGRVITVAYLGLGPDLPRPVAPRAAWTPVADVLEGRTVLAFDHAGILRDALERARTQLEHTTIAARFCPEPFTVGELRRIYEVVWGFKLDPSNFRRKMTRAEAFLEPTGEQRFPEVGRPAALYRRGSARYLVPPLLRSAAARDACP